VLRELLAATKKNLLRLFRLRVSAGAILFGPLLLIIVIGLAFSNTSLHDIKVGAYAQERTEYVDNILSKLETKGSTFDVEEYTTEAACIKSVKDGKSHICTTFGKAQDGTSSVSFHVDYSRLSLVLILISAMNEHVSAEASVIGADISKSLLDAMHGVSQYVDENDVRLADITGDSATMLANIGEMRKDIAALDMSSPVDPTALDGVAGQASAQRKAIASQQKQVNAEIKSSKTQISQTKAELERTASDLEESQVKMTQGIAQIKASETALQCGSVDVEDLSAYLDDQAGLEQKLTTISRPDCSVLYTMRLNMESMLAQSQTIEQKLDVAITQLDDAEDRLDNFQDDYDEGSDEAIDQIDAAEKQLSAMSAQLKEGNAKVEDLKTMRASLLQQLDDAERSLNASVATLGAVKESLGEAKESLSGVGSLTPEAIVKPFSTDIKSVTGARRQFDFLFPSLLALVIMFVSILAASTIVMKEKNSRAYFRNLIMPAPTFIFFTGAVITTTILAAIQIVVILLIGSLAFDVNIMLNPLLLIAGLLFSVWFFALLGIVFGFLFNSEETTTLISIITGVILFLFSSVIIPMESMDPLLASIARFNPFVLAELLLRNSLLFESPGGFLTPLLLLLAELAVLLVLTLWAITFARKKT
jgi:ABC-type multidrug transport system permease subunit